MANPTTICRVCAAPLTLRQLNGVCESAACRRQHLIEEARRAERYQREALVAEAVGLRDAAAASLGVNATAFPVVIVPHAPGVLGPVPEERLAAFRALLVDLLLQAADPAVENDLPDVLPPPVAPSPSAAAVIGGACGTCQGHCCRTGRDHAWLRPATLRRYALAHPDESPDDIVEAYLARAAGPAVDNSCVYHGPAGCTLPHAMRSDTCNNFLCPGLTEYVRDHNDGPPRAFIASTRGREVAAAAFVDSASVRVVRRPVA